MFAWVKNNRGEGVELGARVKLTGELRGMNGAVEKGPAASATADKFETDSFCGFLGRVSHSVEHARLVGGDHVLNVNEGIFATVLLKEFKGLLDEVSQVVPLTLTVVDLVAEVGVLLFEKVHHGENLTVVGHQRFSNGVTA